MKLLRFTFCGGAVAAIALIAHSQIASGKDVQRVNRYSLHSLAADSSQMKLLSAVIDTRFPSHVETVGAAIDYILHRSGYRHVATAEIQPTLNLPLPQTHRAIGPLDIKTAIETIVGQPWQLYEDPGQRILWFQRAGTESVHPTESSAGIPEPQISRDLIGSSDSAEIPDPVIADSTVTSPTTWTLQKSLTLRENLDNWARSADWSLEWRTRHDYAITHPASFAGTLVDAVGALLKHYRSAPIPLIAKFYSSNSVLVIEPGLPDQGPTEK